MANADSSMFSEPRGGRLHSKQSLRLWLKLLGCAVIVEKRLRTRLDADFGTTLPRFDVLAALERHPDGLKMSALSQFLMVSNGNVTGVVGRLIEDGLVTRTVDQDDRRSATVRLTRKGRDSFLKMAAENERWMDEMFADLSDSQMEELMRLLTHVRRSIDAHPV
ncbi:MAG TPA: MarR family transcriptional regulator [Steroidobacteraceae bacterium]|nr:MarR family transcriptional regulator [Steroidobacteraceae bacterium]